MDQGLEDFEKRLLDQYLPFYKDLASGRRKPATEDQKHFVQVSMGKIAPVSSHEVAFLKYCGTYYSDLTCPICEASLPYFWRYSLCETCLGKEFQKVAEPGRISSPLGYIRSTSWHGNHLS